MPTSEYSFFCKVAESEQHRSMKGESLSRDFDKLSTPLIIDATLSLKIPLRISPLGIRPMTSNRRLAGAVLAGQTFWKCQCFPESNAKRTTQRGFGHR
jgi:hypothetical protein